MESVLQLDRKGLCAAWVTMARAIRLSVGSMLLSAQIFSTACELGNSGEHCAAFCNENLQRSGMNSEVRLRKEDLVGGSPGFRRRGLVSPLLWDKDAWQLLSVLVRVCRWLVARSSQPGHNDLHHTELCQLYQLPCGVAQDSERETQIVTEVVQVRVLITSFSHYL